MHILVVEDEVRLARQIAVALTEAGHDPLVVGQGGARCRSSVTLGPYPGTESRGNFDMGGHISFAREGRAQHVAPLHNERSQIEMHLLDIRTSSE